MHVDTVRSSVLAITTQQRLGLAVVGVMLVGWLIYIATTLRRPAERPGSEMVLAPNRKPYLDDDILEGPKLERVLGWALVLLVFVAVGLAAYWLRESSRQEGAAQGFEQRAVRRGYSLFQPTDSPEHGAHFGCATCHGSVGQGGVTTYSLADPANPDAPPRQVSWAAPPLDTVLLRFSRDEVRRVIVYGRPNTPMPAWGSEGGGPMNDQQVDDLVAYIDSITLSRQEAREQTAKLGTDGRTLFEQNCARCHTKGWSYGEPQQPGAGAFGPNLTNGSETLQFPNPADHREFITLGSEFEKAYGARGVGSGRMPGFGSLLSEEQIDAIVQYERGL